jgi:predicted DNA-binding transcriptional regulator AlpA
LTVEPPKSFHLDKRAANIAARVAEHDPDQLIDTPALADLLGVSVQWIKLSRMRGFGVPFIKIGPHRIRYRRDAIAAWLQEREHASTAEYSTGRRSRPDTAA